jgi:ABC-type proline/glycine betaine transport system permease subunit/ABC-type proline/glycine betaine transport system substrate-binding protein
VGDRAEVPRQPPLFVNVSHSRSIATETSLSMIPGATTGAFSRARVALGAIRAWPLLVLIVGLGWSPLAWADYCGSGRAVALAGVNWESGEFITAVTREILERGFGCRTETIPGNTVTLEQAVANNDVQIFTEEWVSRSDVWKDAAAKGLVRGVGHPFVGAVEGWYVPLYMVRGDPARQIRPTAPGLTSVAQLGDPKYVAVFSDPEQPGRGRFLNCPSGWTCEGVNTAKLHAYGLESRYVDFRPGTGPAMDAAITSAYAQGQPLLFYYWSPSAIAGKLALFRLEEPPYTVACYKDLTSSNGAHRQGCAAPTPNIVYGVSSKFAADAPVIIAALDRMTFPLAVLNANLVARAEAQRDARAQAVLFLEQRPDVWTSWVTPAVAGRIAASLKSGGAARVQAAAGGFPQDLVFSIRRPVNDAVAALVASQGAAFRAASRAILSVVVLLDTALGLIPWWLLIGVFAGLAWLGTRRVVLTVVVGALMAVVGMLGLWDLMIQTLSLMLISSVVSLLIGLPVGIWVAKSATPRAIILPTLDVMQTMPSFVYLIPALMLFGLGKVPAILATIIYCLPPMIRLTALGIAQVDAEIKEAATAFGVTPAQMLLEVELPLARPSIMAGVNQTIMLALSMVVVASMIGARGLGEQVLNGIQTLDVGKGLEAGVGIVILAIVLDRITQGFGARAEHG